MTGRPGGGRTRPRTTIVTDHDLTTDELWPRDAEHRYRLYARRRADVRIVTAFADLGAMGPAVATLHEEGDLTDDDVIGLLDTHADPTVNGTWLANVYAGGEPCSSR